MAASDKMFAVKLTENDVPGAKFRSCDISEHSVVELQRWLQCRGLKSSGNKSELIDRCRNCLEAGGKNDIVVSIDGGKWFQKKVQEVLANVQSTEKPTVPVLPVTGWKAFPSTSLPEGYCYGTIYDHIITTAKVNYGKSDSENPSSLTDFNTSKPLMKGRQYFRSGHVKNMKHILKDGIQFIKCIVQASFSVQVYYNVSITLHGNSGKVLDASCDCKASAMSRCNHIAALLFAVDDYILEYGHHIAPTSKLCSWNKGRKNKRDPQPCHTAIYSKKMKPDRIIHFDPRPEQQENNSFINDFITTLPSCHSSTMFKQILEIKFEDYEVDKSQLTLRSESALKLFKSTVSGYEPYQIYNTNTQSESEEWHRSRQLRITASTAKEVVNVKTDRGKYHILRRILWGNTLPDLKPLKYGRTNEPKALNQYRASLNKNQTVETSGLWINPKYPELGCSPDGILKTDGKRTSVIEIKCPLVLECIHPHEIEKLQPKQRYALCYTITDGQMSIKKTHAYFYQAQMQMAICETDTCEFIIWSPKGMIVETIKRDIEFWDKILPKMIAFHNNILLPEYLEMRVPRRLMPCELCLV